MFFGDVNSRFVLICYSSQLTCVCVCVCVCKCVCVCVCVCV